jgi:NDP-sugar pyrophosphorylase family protein
MIENCGCCGARIRKYTHKINKPLCAALIKAYQKHGIHKFKLSELGLSTSQFCNFQKLRYFNLVFSVDKEQGVWFVTGVGEEFVKGMVTVSSHVTTFRGVVDTYGDHQVFLGEIIEGYQYRSDYNKDLIWDGRINE